MQHLYFCVPGDYCVLATTGSLECYSQMRTPAVRHSYVERPSMAKSTCDQ
jgi:hypothetical protein